MLAIIEEGKYRYETEGLIFEVLMFATLNTEAGCDTNHPNYDFVCFDRLPTGEAHFDQDA